MPKAEVAQLRESAVSAKSGDAAAASAATKA
jgi:hypothetical protein